MKNLFLKKLLASKTLAIEDDLNVFANLAKQGFYSSAFLYMWRIVETVSREIILLNRASAETHTTLKNILKILEKKKIDTTTQNLVQEIESKLFIPARKRLKGSCRYIDIGSLNRAFSDLEIEYDKEKIKFLLASSLTKDEKKEAELVPAGLNEKITIREKRNRLTHQSQSISADEYIIYLQYFQYYFDLIISIRELAENERNKNKHNPSTTN